VVGRGAVDARTDGTRRLATWCLAAAFLLLSGHFLVLPAQDRDQASRRFLDVQEKARALVEAGRVKPLREVVQALQVRIPGEVIDVELLEIGPEYFYRFKVLTAEGRVEDAFVDAKTPEVLTLPQLRQRFPTEMAELESKQKAAAATPPIPNDSLANLPPRLRPVMRDLQARVEGKIVDFNFRRLANSPIFIFDLRTDAGRTPRFFVHSRTGEIRTPEDAREFISQRFPWLMDELYPPKARPN
jgi:uncharacterized membrane protein YkoI